MRDAIDTSVAKPLAQDMIVMLDKLDKQISSTSEHS